MSVFHDLDVKELIPQKVPFVMVGKLLAWDENKCTSSFQIEPDNLLCTNGRFNPSGLIENMAQTCALKMGYECFIARKKVPLGFIGDVRDFSFTHLPLTGEEIETEINIVNLVFDVTIISGVVKLNGEEIASCKMKIFVKPPEEGGQG